MQNRSHASSHLSDRPVCADALVVRNAGGSVGSALDSLIALDYFIGTFEDIFVIQHTGTLFFTLPFSTTTGYSLAHHHAMIDKTLTTAPPFADEA